MKYLRKNYAILLAGVILLTLGATGALADIQVYDLTVANNGLPGATGPFLEVTVDLTSSTTATVTFDSLTNGGNLYKMTDGSSAAINVNSTNFTITGVTGDSAGGNSAYSVQNPPGTSQVDGFGTFNGVIDTFDSFTDSSTEIAFTLTNLSGTWSSAANVTTPNDHSPGEILAAHVGACDPTSCTAFSNTGFVSGANAVPEPRQLGLLLALGGLMAIAVHLRKRILAN